MRFLSRRDHSSGELRQKLFKREYDRELVEEVIADFIDRGWVDDEKFASHQARLLVDRGWGPMQIRQRLEKHGVDRELAADSVEQLGVNWVDVARARLETKFGELERDDHERAYRHLTYRGFSPHTARRAIFD